MKLFGFLNKKDGTDNTPKISLPVLEPSTAQEDIVSEEASKPRNNEEEKRPLTVSYATGWPIDIVYGYLHKNYEQKGFEDAMLKCDLTFRDLNMNIIKNKILMVLREINLNYDIMRQDLQERANNCSAAGLLTTVSELEKKIALIDSHKEELRCLEDNFRNNTSEASIPLQSYECGFLRGVATIAMGGNGNRGIEMSLKNETNTYTTTSVSA